MSADGDQMGSEFFRTMGAVEEGLKRKADAADVQMELRRTVEYVTGETRREVRLVLDRVDALRDDVRRDISGIEEDMATQAAKSQATSEELHEVSGKVDRLNDDIAELSELVKGIANRPRTTVAEWVRWGFLALGVLGAFITGNWEAISHFRL
jgi:chromosome segregation ATPase